MDRLLAERLNEKSDLFDGNLFKSLATTAEQYVQAGLSTLAFYTSDLDYVSDMTNCWSALDGINNAASYDSMRCTPKAFIDPTGATEIETLTSAVAQILFGTNTSRKVE